MALLPTIDHKIIEIVSIERCIRIVIFYLNGSFCGLSMDLVYGTLLSFMIFWFFLRFIKRKTLCEGFVLTFQQFRFYRFLVCRMMSEQGMSDYKQKNRIHSSHPFQFRWNWLRSIEEFTVWQANSIVVATACFIYSLYFSKPKIWSNIYPLENRLARVSAGYLLIGRNDMPCEAKVKFAN